MTTLRIHHRTRYRYAAPVTFGEHRLMLRPRDGHDLRILDSALTLSPPGEVRWAYDTFGNSVAFATFSASADELVIQSDLLLRRYALDEPVASAAAQAVPYPFAYDAEELVDLAALMRIQHPDDRPAVAAWLDDAIAQRPDNSLELLQAVSGAIHADFSYRRREEQGVQAPGYTLETRSGTCRDFAFLFMEAARHLGFAARFVTGYLYDPAADSARGKGEAMTGGGATHAWADIFVPGVGWMEIDPTNRIIAGRNLVRVATTRAPSQALPIQGSYEGKAAFLDMEVTVELTQSLTPGEESLQAHGAPAPAEPAPTEQAPAQQPARSAAE